MSGAGNVIPTVPTFVTGDTSLLKLQQLSYAVSFLTDQDVRPTWHFYKTTTQSIPASTWTAVTSGTVAYDNDGVYSNFSAQIVTTGYYVVEACLQIIDTATIFDFYTAFQIVAGANNPHHTSGTNSGFFGQRMSATSANTVTDNANCISDTCPWVLYPGDVVSPMIWVSAAATADHNTNNSYMQGRFATTFSGYLSRTGT
jgi:hypothetical protein